MTIKNLSVIFTPALFHDHNQVENAGEWYSDIVLQDLIQQHETLFLNSKAKPIVFDSPSASVLSLPYTIASVPKKTNTTTNN